MFHVQLVAICWRGQIKKLTLPTVAFAVCADSPADAFIVLFEDMYARILYAEPDPLC